MYDEERNFSWTNLFIKVIIVIIIILFAVWLVSLTNKKVSNKLDVITDNIFSENVEKLKIAGKDYFTTDKLPKEVGDVEKITLEKMYDDKLLLTLKNKSGEACLANKSYVSVEKMEKEYKMRVYLDCGEEKDYIIFPMEWYGYCTINTCEGEKNVSSTTSNSNNVNNNSKKTANNNVNNNANTSTNNNTNNNVNNNVSNNTNPSTVTDIAYVTAINDYRCNKKTGKWIYIKSCQPSSVSGAKCSVKDGENVLLNYLTGGAGCSASKPGTSSNTNNNTNPSTVTNSPYVTAINDYRCDKKTGKWIYIKSCQSPSVSGAKCSVKDGNDVLLGNLTNGAYCSTAKPGSSSNTNENVTKYEYVKTTSGYWTNWSDYSEWSTTKVTSTDYREVRTKSVSESYTLSTPKTSLKLVGNPTKCPEAKKVGDGYKYIGIENGVCKYEKENKEEVLPECPEATKLGLGNEYKFKKRDGFNCVYEKTTQKEVKPVCENDNPNAELIIQKGFLCRYSVKVSDRTLNDTGRVYKGWEIPKNTNKIEYKFVRKEYRDRYVDGKLKKNQPYYIYKIYEVVDAKYELEEKVATCYYETVNGKCIMKRTIPLTKKDSAVCLNSKKSGNVCIKTKTLKAERPLECSSNLKYNNGKCYSTYTETTGYKNVTYYSYRTRKYIEGTTSYEWSTSKNDAKLLNLGYKLTGRTV